MIEEREVEAGGRPAAPSESEIKTFLGQGTEFQGTLSFEGAIRIDGKLSGEVVSQDTLIVGEDAEVDAEISVGVLISRGKIKGNVKVSNRLELHDTSELRGNIATPLLLIAEGAVFHGSCEMPQAADKVTPISPPKPTEETSFEGRDMGEEVESGS